MAGISNWKYVYNWRSLCEMERVEIATAAAALVVAAEAILPPHKLNNKSIMEALPLRMKERNALSIFVIRFIFVSFVTKSHIDWIRIKMVLLTEMLTTKCLHNNKYTRSCSRSFYLFVLLSVCFFCIFSFYCIAMWTHGVKKHIHVQLLKI